MTTEIRLFGGSKFTISGTPGNPDCQKIGKIKISDYGDKMVLDFFSWLRDLKLAFALSAHVLDEVPTPRSRTFTKNMSIYPNHLKLYFGESGNIAQINFTPNNTNS